MEFFVKVSFENCNVRFPLLLQYSISSAKWPSSDYEVLIAEQKKMKLLGNNITYDAYTAATLTADENMHGRIEDIKDEISSNFLKVTHQWCDGINCSP